MHALYELRDVVWSVLRACDALMLVCSCRAVVIICAVASWIAGCVVRQACEFRIEMVEGHGESVVSTAGVRGVRLHYTSSGLQLNALWQCGVAERARCVSVRVCVTVAVSHAPCTPLCRMYLGLLL